MIYLQICLNVVFLECLFIYNFLTCCVENIQNGQHVHLILVFEIKSLLEFMKIFS